MDADTYISRTSTGHVTKLKPRPRERTYASCRRPFLGYPAARSCPDCAAVRAAERDARARVLRVAKLSKRRAAAREQLTCATCGAPVRDAQRNRPGAAYCSPAHRQRAHRRRAGRGDQ